MYWVSDGSLTSTALGRRALIGCMYASVATGVTYGFSMYSSALKEQFCFSQQQLANLNTIQFSLGPFSPLFGAFARRCGVKGTLLLGGLWVSSAQIVFYLVATQRIHAGNPAKVLLGISMLQYMGIQLISSCAFSTPIMHFQRQRGMAAALVKSFVGLAGAVVSQLYVFLFGVPGAEPEALNCILLWASVSLSCCVVASVVVPSTPDESAREPRTMLRYLHTHLLVLTGVGTAVALAPYGPVHRGLVPVLLAMALAPLALALAPCWDRQRALREGDEAPLPTVGLLWHVEGAAAAAAALTTLPILKLESSVSYTTLQMLRTPDAWLLCGVGSVVIGGGNMLSTNFGQIVQACGASEAFVPTVVTLFSTGNLLGRLVATIVSDRVLAFRGRPRPWIAAGIAALMGSAQLVLLLAGLCAAGSVGQAALLVLGSVCAGIAFGSMWPNLVVLASELFGSTHLAANYLFFDGGCGAVGSLLLANLLPTFFYSRAATDDDEGGSGDGSGADLTNRTCAGSSSTCLGAQCFLPTHSIIAGLCLLAVVASAVIARRSAGLYRQIKRNADLIARAAVGAREGATSAVVGGSGASGVLVPGATEGPKPTLSLQYGATSAAAMTQPLLLGAVAHAHAPPPPPLSKPPLSAPPSPAPPSAYAGVRSATSASFSPRHSREPSLDWHTIPEVD